MPIHHPAVNVHHHHHYRHWNPPAIVMIHVPWEKELVKLTPEIKSEYNKEYLRAAIRPNRVTELRRVIATIVAGEDRYKNVSATTNIPWYVIGALHYMECNANFTCHLHNGDPLTHRTVNVPVGRPLIWKRPFTWEASAVDALTFDGFSTWTDWSIAGTLYKMEGYNGFGSRNHGIESPYLWGGSTLYTKGKYVADGIWSPVAVSQQIGAGIILHEMARRGIINLP